MSTTWTPEQIREHNAKVARDAQAARERQKPGEFVEILESFEADVRMADARSNSRPVRKLNEERPKKDRIADWCDGIFPKPSKEADARAHPRPVRKLNDERNKPNPEMMNALNVLLTRPETTQKPSPCAADAPSCHPKHEKASDGMKVARSMNLTERRYAIILNAQKQHNEVLDFRYEGIRLRWGGCMNYTPDFILFMPNGAIRLIEVKGAHIRDRDIVRFKGCRHEWPMFDFQMWQWKDRQWTQKY